MNKTIPISKARVNLGAVVNGVRERGDVVIVEKDGIPVASIVGVDVIEDLHDALAMVEARLRTQKEPIIEWARIRAKYV